MNQLLSPDPERLGRPDVPPCLDAVDEKLRAAAIPMTSARIRTTSVLGRRIRALNRTPRNPPASALIMASMTITVPSRS